MNVEEIRKLLYGQPFRTFTIHVADEGRISVKHEDFVAFASTGREIIVYPRNGANRKHK